MNTTSSRRTILGLSRNRMLAFAGLAIILVLGLLPAQAAAAEGEIEYVLNTFAFLIWGALVMWMAAGFTMLEAGSVRTKNASVICLKNIGLYCIAGLTFYAVGYNLMYTGVDGGWIGSLKFLYGTSADEIAVLNGTKEASTLLESDYAVMSDWFFQMVFVGTTASIVSGALAERVKLWSFFLFIALLTGSSTRSSGRRPGAAAGSRRWASRTSRGPRSFTRPAAGRPWRDCWWWVRARASTARTGRSSPRLPRTFRPSR